MFNKWRNIYNGKRYAKRGDFNKVLTLSPQTYLSYKDLTDYPMDYDAYIAEVIRFGISILLCLLFIC